MRVPRFSALTAGLLLLLAAGCGVQTPPLQTGTPLSGNWSFQAQSKAQNQPLTLNLGFTQGSYETVSAVARLNGASCVSPATNILLTGSVSGNNALTLVSQPFGGTTLVLQGEVAATGNAIGGATWSFKGGSCGSLGQMNVAATDYSQISGQYSGNFTDTSGNSLPVEATLLQTTQPNANGQFTLSGTATFPSNTCFVDQPTLTSSVVTGDALSMTYADSSGGAVLTAAGTFNSTATQLTISHWSIAGGNCDGDSGTGVLTEGAQ